MDISLPNTINSHDGEAAAATAGGTAGPFSNFIPGVDRNFQPPPPMPMINNSLHRSGSLGGGGGTSNSGNSGGGKKKIPHGFGSSDER